MENDPRHLQLKRQQIAGLLLLALVVLVLSLVRAHRGEVFPPGWWRW